MKLLIQKINCEIDSDPDVVDCESFWETVELNIISRAFPGRSFKYLEIKPDLSNWSPFVGKLYTAYKSAY